MSASPRLKARRSETALSHTDPTTSAKPPVSSQNPTGPSSNTAAFAHNAAFPPGPAPLPASLRDPPDFHIRKPSVTGLHLETDVSKQRQEQATQGQKAASSIEEAQVDRLEKPRLFSRRSWDSSAGSPTSSTSSPMLGALEHVTPLPSPIVTSFSSDMWTRKPNRPHSGSNASIERDRSAGLLSPAITTTSPQRRKKTYGALRGSPPGFADSGTPERIRAHSEYVPDQLQNARPRIVTGPAPSPPPTRDRTLQPDGSMHREQYMSKSKKSVDLGVIVNPTGAPPSPPPSTSTPSDEETEKPSQPFLHVTDLVTHKKTTWKPLRILGNGSFSEVILATRDTHAGSIDSGVEGVSADARPLVAVKIVQHHSSSDEERMDTSIKREIEILRSISHPSLPQLQAFEDNATRALLVLNYCPGGDLFELASQQREVLTNDMIQRIFAELVGAVTYLHQRLIVHRDIKLENVLLNLPTASLPTAPQDYPHPLITLTDLGLAKHIAAPPASSMLTHPCGSVDYAAPEVLLGQPYDGRATDAWALGVLLYALMEGRLPFDPIPNPRRRGGNNVKHRIARCDWLWCEFGDEYGDWKGEGGKCKDLEGARECVEGLLKKVGRGRWGLERLGEHSWVREGIRLPGGLTETFDR